MSDNQLVVVRDQAILDCVTSVCTVRDLAIWELAAREIPKHISARRYRVIVPDDQVDVFKARSPKQFEVHAESGYATGLMDIIRSKMPENNKHRAGWYLQQFIKIASLINNPPGECHLIWDSDTIPLKPLNFFTDEGKLVFYKSHERNPDYLPPIERLLGSTNRLQFSFIAQCLPYKSDWAQEFAERLEQLSSKSWEEAIIDAIDFSKISGFSEYETLGAYALEKHANEFEVINRPWFRYGGTLLGNIGNMERSPYRWLLKRYDFISIESWDEDSKLPRIINFLNALRKELLTKGSL